jgi:PEP-CTERM motif-containing protein
VVVFYFSLTASGGGSMAVSSMAPGDVPEPATLTLMIGGFGVAGAALRRKRNSAFAA